MENHAVSGLGAGIIIFHEKKILMVQMNYGRYKGHWIIPGGSVDEGEHPSETAVRELKEETGLSGFVTGMLAVRHRIHSNKKANVYYVFKGELDKEDLIEPQKKLKWPEEELISAKFWDIEEALEDDLVRPVTRLFIQKALEKQVLNSKYPLPDDHYHNDEVFGL
ncbi:MAG: NUDIX hydrolase [Bdellovibrionota bacterium]|nr:NUDIX hydrolase [Bdellovibrionota bacterium]